MMNFEFFADGSQDCPLILIYGTDIAGALNLSLVIEKLATGLTDYIDIHDIPGYNPINDCRLRLQITPKEAQGVQIKGTKNFIWRLSREECYDVIDLLEPFSEDLDDTNAIHRHQYLEHNGDIKIIFSTDRQW